MRFLPLFILSILVFGCSPAPSSTPEPTLQIVRIGFTPSTIAWQDELYGCAQSIPGVGLAVYEKPDLTFLNNGRPIDFFIQLGGEIPGSKFVTQLGMEEIVWISNLANPIDHLTHQQLADIYLGNGIKEAGDVSGSTSLINVWIYPQEDALAKFLTEVMPTSKSFLSTAYIAPDPAAMLQAVSENPLALGYVPISFLEDISLAREVNRITLTDPDGKEWHPALQIFAISTAEPVSSGREVLLCFKESQFQTR
jgi:hypothetical protein